MHRSCKRSSRASSTKAIVRAAAAVIALSPGVLLATDYSFVTSSGTWSNSANWSSPSGPGVPGAGDNINQSSPAQGSTILLDSVGDSITNISLNTSGNSLTFESPSSSADTLSINGTVTQAGGSAGIVFGINTNPLTISTGTLSPYTYVPFQFTQTSGSTNGPNVTIADTNSIGTLTFAPTYGGSFRVGNNTTSSTLTIQGNVVIGGVADFQIRPVTSNGNGTSTANITVQGASTGTLSSTLAVDVLSGLSGNSIFTLAGSATGLVASGVANLTFGGAANGSAAQSKLATLQLANSNAVNTGGLTIPINIGTGTTLGTSVTANLSVLSNVPGANYSNSINVNGFTNASATETYTIGGNNTTGITTFSGQIKSYKNLQLESLNPGAAAAFTGNISNATSTFAAAITTVGSGLINLTGNNTYSGGTTISNAGNVQIDNATGSALGSGPVAVSGIGATLSGTGSSTGGVTVGGNGRLAPGDNTTAAGTAYPNFGGVGKLTIGSTGGLTLNGANLDFDLSKTPGTPASNDMISTSSFALIGSVAVTIAGTSSTLATGTAYELIQVVGGGSSVTSSAVQTAFSSTTFVGSLAGANYVSTYSVDSSGDVDVTFSSPSPEPGSAFLVLAGGGLMSLRRRRHRKPGVAAHGS